MHLFVAIFIRSFDDKVQPKFFGTCLWRQTLQHNFLPLQEEVLWGLRGEWKMISVGFQSDQYRVELVLQWEFELYEEF